MAFNRFVEAESVIDWGHEWHNIQTLLIDNPPQVRSQHLDLPLFDHALRSIDCIGDSRIPEGLEEVRNESFLVGTQNDLSSSRDVPPLLGVFHLVRLDELSMHLLRGGNVELRSVRNHLTVLIFRVEEALIWVLSCDVVDLLPGPFVLELK